MGLRGGAYDWFETLLGFKLKHLLGAGPKLSPQGPQEPWHPPNPLNPN